MSDKVEQGETELLAGTAGLGAGLMGAEAVAGTAAATAAGAVGGAVMVAGAAGVGIGMGIEHVTGGAISDTISDGLMGLVGEEESYAAAQSFDDGNYLEGAGHMASGAYDTVSDAASGAYDTVADTASDVYDTVSDAASDALDYINPFD
jgi:phage-related tail protein